LIPCFYFSFHFSPALFGFLFLQWAIGPIHILIRHFVNWN
jgi:hypothetical protein